MVAAVSRDLARSLAPLVISAPFGNYIQPAGTTATVGTYTAARRGGRPAAFGRALLTTRYYRRLGAWVNRIGLRNPGIDSLRAEPKRGNPLSQCLLSIHGFTPADWELLLERTIQLKPMAVELNISCPNVGELSWPDNLFRQAVATGIPVIVKIPPVRFHPMVEAATAADVRWIHATNTLPVPKGGLSGVPLKPLALSAVKWLRESYGTELGIIGGGGIRAPEDIVDYAAAGADRFAVGSYAMRPSVLNTERWVADLRQSAGAMVKQSQRTQP